MPIYEYRCETEGCSNEGNISDVEHKTWYNDGVSCIECDEYMERLISLPLLVSVEDPKTLKQQADFNTKRLGHYEKEEKQRQYDLYTKKNKPKDRWYQADDATNKKIKKMGKEQQKHYIIKGD